MLTENYFPDKIAREFVPYKGYCKILEDGTEVKDEVFNDNEGPFKIIVESLSHGNWHTLYNILDKDGNKMLPKGIRKITYYEEGYYLLEDDNEDELANRHGCGIPCSEFISRMNVLFEDGTFLTIRSLINDERHNLIEDWFLQVIPQIGHFRVQFQNKKWGELDFSGETYFGGIYHLSMGCIVKFLHGVYSIFSPSYELMAENFSSVMCANKHLWKVNLLRSGENAYFLHGHNGPEIINYAREILIKTNILALLEKDGTWYSLDSMGNLIERFIWDPKDIELTSIR